MGNKVLVVGARSKVGRELVKGLVERGESVRAVTRQPGEVRAPASVEVMAFDYDVHGSAKPALQDVDRVFMLTKWTELHPELALNRFVEHALAAGVQHVVFLNGMGVDKNPSVGMTLVEKRIAGTGMGYTFLHPNWLMQNFSRGFLLSPVRDISAIVVPGGSSAETSFVDARDVAEVAIAALTDPRHSGQTYYLTGGKALTFNQAANILSDTLGRRITYQQSSDEEFRRLLGDRWETEQVDYLLGLLGYVRAGQAAETTSTVATILGREPTPFEKFAQDHADVWR